MQPLEHAGHTVVPRRVLRAVHHDDVPRVRWSRWQSVRVDIDDLHIAAMMMRRCDGRRACKTESEDACLNYFVDSHACTSDYRKCKELAGLRTS